MTYLMLDKKYELKGDITETIAEMDKFISDKPILQRYKVTTNNAPEVQIVGKLEEKHICPLGVQQDIALEPMVYFEMAKVEQEGS